jgi:hypothetical protein
MRVSSSPCTHAPVLLESRVTYLLAVVLRRRVLVCLGPERAHLMCTYEWVRDRNVPLLNPNTYARTIQAQSGHLNNTKNLYRIWSCAGATWRDRQQWSLRVRFGDGNNSRTIGSLAQTALADEYLRCQANKTVHMVGDSHLGQTFTALLRALIAPAERAQQRAFRWVNKGEGLVDYNGPDFDSQPRLHFGAANSTLAYFRCNMFVKVINTRGSTLVNHCLNASIEHVCPDVLILQTGNWFGITRTWPPTLPFSTVLRTTMDTVRRSCPSSRVIWLPPTLPHGGAERIMEHRHTRPGRCYEGRELLNSSQFDRMLALAAGREARSMYDGGKNPNVGAAHRLELLGFANGSLEVVDTSLIGHARAESHAERKDNCAHWCLPGVPELFGGALVQHLCGETLPDPRTCVAA